MTSLRFFRCSQSARDRITREHEITQIIFGVGPRQDLDYPLGVGGMDLHQWIIPTRTFQRMHGEGSAEGTTGTDDESAARGLQSVGAAGIHTGATDYFVVSSAVAWSSSLSRQ